MNTFDVFLHISVFVWDFPHFVIASDIYLFIYLCTRAQRLSRGFYLACRLGSTSNREDFFCATAISGLPLSAVGFFGEF